MNTKNADKIQNMTLRGQKAIVTGGARGIGRGIALRLAAEGCRVVIWDRDLASLKDTLDFQPAYAHQVDLTDIKAVEAAFEATVKAVGDIQILINNAGINGPIVESWNYPLDKWDKVLAVNLTAFFYCSRVVAPHLRERGYGRIVLVASIAGEQGVAKISAYTAAKAGAIGFSKSLARELFGTGVMVNSIIPVMTETDLFKEMTQEHIDYCRSLIPMGRFPKIEEIAAMVTWMASPECSFTTGAVFDITGGRAIH